MQELELTWGRLFRIWWAMYWRAWAIVIIVGFMGILGESGALAIGVVLGAAGLADGLTTETSPWLRFAISFVVTFGLTFIGSLIVLRTVFRKNIENFVLCWFPTVRADVR